MEKRMYARQRRHAQRGSISLLGALGILAGISALVGIMELANAKILDRNLDNYAQSLAPVALRSEIALNAIMIQNGVSRNIAKETVQGALDSVTPKGTVQVHLTFGNIVDGVFVPLSSNANNPKQNLSAADTVPDFAAVAVQLIGQSTFGLVPEGRAIYGLTNDDKDSPEVASCYCDNRYDDCMQQPEANNVMGDPNSHDRQQYCETGFAPSNSGGLFGAFFGGSPKYTAVDSVQFSPQWVGKAYTDGTPQTNTTSQAWQNVQVDAPLVISNGTNPFPEAGWNAGSAIWVTPGQTMQFTTHDFFGRAQVNEINGTFYVGRSGTCAYPSTGFFFFGILKDIQTFMTGNTDCLRYTANPTSQYHFANFLQPFMNSISKGLGANQHYYSCRDFSGLTSSRNGLIQIMRRIWTSPLQNWGSFYQQTGCSAKQMRQFSFLIWSGWKEV
jgi:hypothetical protein